MSPRPRVGPAAAVLGIVIAVASCKAAAPAMKDSAPPTEAERAHRAFGDDGGSDDVGGAGGDAMAAPIPQDIDGLEAELTRAEGELRGLGLGGDEAVQAGATPSPRPASPRPAIDRCERVRVLADRICQLSDRMCDLADEHEDEARYVDACDRAELSCEEARVAGAECVSGG